MRVLTGAQLDGIHPDTEPYFRDVGDHLARVADRVEAFDSLLTDILTANLAQISIQQNEETRQQNEDTRRISAWVAIVAADTVLTGIYGMNFDNMPELHTHYGYFVLPRSPCSPSTSASTCSSGAAGGCRNVRPNRSRKSVTGLPENAHGRVRIPAVVRHSSHGNARRGTGHEDHPHRAAGRTPPRRRRRAPAGRAAPPRPAHRPSAPRTRSPGGPGRLGPPAGRAGHRHVHVGARHQHRQRRDPDDAERLRRDHRRDPVGRHRLLAGARRGRAGERLAAPTGSGPPASTTSRCWASPPGRRSAGWPGTSTA